MIIGVFFVILLSWDIGEKMGLNTCSEPRKQGFPQIKRLWAEKWQCCNKRGLPTTGLAMEGLLALPRHEISICFLLNALPRWGAEGASPGHSARTEARLQELVSGSGKGWFLWDHAWVVSEKLSKGIGIYPHVYRLREWTWGVYSCTSLLCSRENEGTK